MILKIKNEQGKWEGIPAIQGPKGDPGAVGPEGKQGIQGPIGPQGQTGKEGPQVQQGAMERTAPKVLMVKMECLRQFR